MKKLEDILKGFELTDVHPDGTKQYDVKEMHSAYYDYFELNGITIRPNGSIDANYGVNCDLCEGANELDEYHVYELTEIA